DERRDQRTSIPIAVPKANGITGRPAKRQGERMWLHCGAGVPPAMSDAGGTPAPQLVQSTPAFALRRAAAALAGPLDRVGELRQGQRPAARLQLPILRLDDR